MSAGVGTGPRGSRLLVDSQRGVPLVWLQVAIRGGSAADPAGVEGFANHMARLARRGAGALRRRELDEEIDRLGASVSLSAQRDAVVLSAVCLKRNLDRVIDLAADMLARPRMDEDEHDKLLRETRLSLDEVRDDDAQLVARFFNRHCVPGHAYARSVIGTERSLAHIELEAVRAAYRQLVVPGNLVIGMAGDLDQGEAEILAQRLVAELPGEAAPALPSVDSPPMPRGRRLVVVDKPERTQSQILIGHLGPRYGSDESLALILIETVFGGMFTSRLMQEIRVKRGWSYGAGCYLLPSRGAHWFRIYLAPPAPVTADALALTLDMFDDLARRGITAEEHEFARSYLAGHLPFRVATARQRLRLGIQAQLFGLPDDFAATLPGRLAAITLDEACEAARRWLHPDDALAVVVATATATMPQLTGMPWHESTVLAHDSY